jgi:pyridoxamine 5'-phosphate oxidase
VRELQQQPGEDLSLRGALPAEPFSMLSQWLEDARQGGYVNPDAICVSTVDAHGSPRARMVLCRALDRTAGTLTFYTNRESAKGRDLAHRPEATAVFYWDQAGRQAIVSGSVEHAPDADSDVYWAARPRLSQLSAWASQQSQPISSRAALLARLAAVAERFGGEDANTPVPRPPHWGGYRIVARRVELWVGSPGRFHDRALWTRTEHGWSVMRLQP